MKVSIFRQAAVIGVSALLMCATPTLAEAPPVALIDLKYIFDNHPQVQAIQNDVKALNDGAKKSREELKDRQEEIRDLKIGTPEYKDAEADLIKLESEIKAQELIESRKLKEQQLKVFMTVFLDIQDAVSKYCEENGITLVMQFDGDPVKNDWKEVGRYLNRAVVYHEKSVDITPFIMDRVLPSDAGDRNREPEKAASRGKSGVPKKNR